MILDKLYINGRLCQEEIEEGEAGRGGRSQGDQIGRGRGASGWGEFNLRGQRW